MKSLQGKIVWITGASSGIGEQLAIVIAAQGARLILSARDEMQLNRVAEMCKGAASVLVVPLDLSQPALLADIVKATVAKLGRIDILINNAGLSQRGLAIDTDWTVDEYIMRVNFLGTVALTKAVLPTMRKYQLGQIVVISSVVGKMGIPKRSAYSASKHALHGFFEALRAEVFEDNIHITLVCPGFVRTNISRNALNDKGLPQGSMDEATDKGLSPRKVAERIVVAMLEKKEDFIIAGVKEKFGVFLFRFWPSRFRAMLRKTKVT